MIRAILISAALLASACAPHRIQYYQLSAFEKQARIAEAGPTLVVARITTPEALQDGRIRYLEGPNEVGAYEYHRWTDPPGLLVKEALIQVLRASGTFRSVDEAGSSAAGDYSLRGKLLEFAEVDGAGMQTRVSLDFELRDTKTGRVVWSQTLTHNEPLQAKKVSEVVQSLDRNLRGVLEQAAAGIGAAIAAR
ncbi:MAG: ABC-type transport auxiliary lipoprotein family protein [Bryobacteraceae bacterium]